MSTPVDVLMRMENGSNGDIVDATILAAATLGTGGTWTTSPTTLTELKVSTAQEADVDGVDVGGVGSDDTGTRSFKMNCAVDSEYAKYSFTGRANVSIGVALRISGYSSGNYDLIAIGGGGDFVVLALIAGPTIVLHTGAGDTSGFTPTQDVWYWVTMQRDYSNLLGRMKVYTLADMALVYDDTLLMDETDCDHVALGRYDNHNQFDASCNIYFDDLAMSLDGSRFPILPDTATRYDVLLENGDGLLKEDSGALDLEDEVEVAAYDILLESGDGLLKEGGDRIDLEENESVATAYPSHYYTQQLIAA